MLMRHSPARRLARQAFTLMEMMVVVAIIVILSGIAIVAYTTFSDRGNEAKAAAAIKQIDFAVNAYYLDHNNIWPETLAVLQQPDEYGKVYLKADALVPPWQGASYVYDPQGTNNRAMGEAKPDIYIDGPGYRYANWIAGKQPLTQ